MSSRKMRLVATLSESPQGAALGFEGRTYGEWLSDFGGFTGRIDDPFGQWHEVSVRVFDGADPNLYLDFTFDEQSEAGLPWPDLSDGQAVLKEWDLVGHPEVRWVSDYIAPEDPPRWGLHP